MNKKNILITGSSTGIGKITALKLAENGYNVFAGVRKEEDRLILNNLHESITAVILDVTSMDDIKKIFEYIKNKVFGSGLYALINNAGVTTLGPIELASKDEIHNTMNINFFGALNMIKTFLPLLRMNGGRILNISSTSAMNPVPYAGIYAASKCALEGACDSLRMELFHMGIRIINLRPGNIKTPIWNKVKQNMEKSLASLNMQEQRLYKKDILGLMEMLEKNNSKTLSPEVVASKICNVIKLNNPKAYYLVGKSAYIQYFAKTIFSINFFDWIKRKAFFKRKTDWSGKKYLIAEELGECIDMIFAKIVDNKIKGWKIRSHVVSDGVGAFTDIVNSEGYKNLEVPKMKVTEIPSFFKKIKLFFEYKKTSKLINYEFKYHSPEIRGAGKGISLCIFSYDETKEIFAYCKTKKISINAFLLWSLNRIVNEKLLKNKKKNIWLLPVNFRQTNNTNQEGNTTSSLNIPILPEEGPHAIQQEIRSQYKKGLQWGAWFYSNMIKYVGQSVMTFIYKHFYKGPWIGVFSNVGIWPTDNYYDENDNVVWFGAPPVTSICPISASCMSWNKRLMIDLQLHPSISKNIDDTDKLMREWRKLLECDMKSEFKTPIQTILREDIVANAERF